MKACNANSDLSLSVYWLRMQVCCAMYLFKYKATVYYQLLGYKLAICLHLLSATVYQ